MWVELTMHQSKSFMCHRELSLVGRDGTMHKIYKVLHVSCTIYIYFFLNNIKK